jgi:hypothetical protein
MPKKLSDVDSDSRYVFALAQSPDCVLTVDPGFLQIPALEAGDVLAGVRA